MGRRGRMTYLISDIHGCYKQFQALLAKIAFTDDDELFILGDAVDRGPEPMQTLRYIMEHPNMTLIMGNHEAVMRMVLRRLATEITEESIEKLTPDVLEACADWMQDGGSVTLAQFRKLDRTVQADILNYLEDIPCYQTLEYDGKLYILVHAGLENFAVRKELEEYQPGDFLWERPDYAREYFPGGRITLVTGHTPTPHIRKDGQPLIYTGKGHLAIDCGCVFGGRLAAYCMETGDKFYVDGLEQDDFC